MNTLKCEIGGTEQYLKPEMEIIKMENDVILTSCTSMDVPLYSGELG